MTDKPLFTLNDEGRAVVSLSGKTYSEEEWDTFFRAYEAFMRPVRRQRLEPFIPTDDPNFLQFSAKIVGKAGPDTDLDRIEIRRGHNIWVCTGDQSRKLIYSVLSTQQQQERGPPRKIRMRVTDQTLLDQLIKIARSLYDESGQNDGTEPDTEGHQ
jgi:hypothetical protein